MVIIMLVGGFIQRKIKTSRKLRITNPSSIRKIPAVKRRTRLLFFFGKRFFLGR
jgi:hypothetical protein